METRLAFSMLGNVNVIIINFQDSQLQLLQQVLAASDADAEEEDVKEELADGTIRVSPSCIFVEEISPCVVSIELILGESSRNYYGIGVRKLWSILLQQNKGTSAD